MDRHQTVSGWVDERGDWQTAIVLMTRLHDRHSQASRQGTEQTDGFLGCRHRLTDATLYKQHNIQAVGWQVLACSQSITNRNAHISKMRRWQ